ncbi:unnamed protein product [Linum tenue]|uniref:Uncharacterized protein n=1 Tax=Linum tenue TaxID=586396 RepID=A0AAV0RFH5_9ROSI|nr:unnamed protein product [Linum tenue]
MARRLQGKVALITGGARGIGAAAARLFSQHGAKVVIADIRSDLGRSVSNQIQLESGHPVSYVQCDVASDSDMQNAVDAAVSTYGKLDIMYSNAGIAGERFDPLAKIKKEAFGKVFDVNVYGSFLAAKHAARVMVPRKSGTILLTGSAVTASYGTTPHMYSASKHAVVGLAKNLCVELGEFGIRVNCISSFGTPTPMGSESMGLDEKTLEEMKALEEMFSAVGNLKGVVLKPEDVAEAALNLVSDESKYLSGLNLLVDGGYCLKSAY